MNFRTGMRRIIFLFFSFVGILFLIYLLPTSYWLEKLCLWHFELSDNLQTKVSRVAFLAIFLAIPACILGIIVVLVLQWVLKGFRTKGISELKNINSKDEQKQ